MKAVNILLLHGREKNSIETAANEMTPTKFSFQTVPSLSCLCQLPFDSGGRMATCLASAQSLAIARGTVFPAFVYFKVKFPHNPVLFMHVVPC